MEEIALLERREGAWSIELSPRVVRVRHSRGMEYLARLLERPGVEFDALELHGGPPPGEHEPEEAVAERARRDVTRAIRTAIRRVARDDPLLGLHLERAVRTGQVCIYRGSSERPISWQVETGEE